MWIPREVDSGQSCDLLRPAGGREAKKAWTALSYRARRVAEKAHISNAFGLQQSPKTPVPSTASFTERSRRVNRLFGGSRTACG